jgi:hypothetical protein
MEEHPFTTSVCVDHDGIAHVETPAERDLLAVGRPDGIEFVDGVFRELSDSTPVRVHDVDIEVAVAAAVEGDPTLEVRRRREAEPRFVGPGGERPLAVTGCEKSPEGEEWTDMQSAAHMLPRCKRRHGDVVV